ncbi:meiotically up-regulated gene 113-domain-containing protein [Dactylonectria estremocensis]|uniref:Meiotically up-regulated gene 113-domain-containing protein n=1 Tax=Dactylonectria estremocensis TaxID=1079267 RepID=A0A9P9EPS3_9HYPO|nr:meiotically up-regulated gene 113-domain-containing protein [Dactylonectria estremocensis]
MPFVANTPESFINRSDSLNPNATCRGITSNGRPCRRPIAGAKSPTLKPSRRPLTPDPSDESLYCWQHKEQASLPAHSSPGPRDKATPILEGRSSIDTLADRLGLVDLQHKPKRKTGGQIKTGNGGAGNGSLGNGYKPTKPPRTKQKKTLQFCFCFSVPLEEVAEDRPPRPQPRPVQRTSMPVPASRRSSIPQSSSKPSRQRIDASTASPGRNSNRSRKSTGSQTARVKDLIPDSLDPPTASALMTELARPFVDSEEAGFIYMFWLTPISKSAAPVEAARSLLAPPSPAGGTRSRRPSDVVSRFTTDPSSASADKTMVLKIGRAANVQRRMNQWQRQCGYDIEMLRYYPYIPGASESSGVVPHMTPHCHRVERLVHIELAGMGLRANKDNCDACGRDHREWFEVEATREGVRKVDEVIRRWIQWDEA